MNESIWLPDTPAFGGLFPPEVCWQALDKTQADLICRDSGLEGQVERMVNHQAWPRGYYRILGSSCYFLKVTDVSHAARQVDADSMAEYLQSQGIRVNRLLKGFPKKAAALSDSQCRLLAYPYLNADFIQPNLKNLASLGEAIGQMHKAFVNAPFSDEVKARGLQRHQALIEKWRQRDRLAIRDTEVRQIFDQMNEQTLMLLLEDAQCVHGDLNFGNVMLDSNGQLVFLDFEDAQSAWFNPLKDLAFVVERFILIYQPNDIEAQLKTLLSAYYQVFPKAFEHADHLVGVLQALAVRSLLILAELETQGRETSETEWEKFIFLYKLAEQKLPHLHDILCRLALK